MEFLEHWVNDGNLDAINAGELCFANGQSTPQATCACLACRATRDKVTALTLEHEAASRSVELSTTSALAKRLHVELHDAQGARVASDGRVVALLSANQRYVRESLTDKAAIADLGRKVDGFDAERAHVRESLTAETARRQALETTIERVRGLHAQMEAELGA